MELSYFSFIGSLFDSLAAQIGKNIYLTKTTI